MWYLARIRFLLTRAVFLILTRTIFFVTQIGRLRSISFGPMCAFLTPPTAQRPPLPRHVPRLLPGCGVDEPETGIEGGDWCQTRPMGLTKGGLPPFSRLPGTLVRLPVEIRSKTALILCPLPGVAYKEGTVGTSQRVPAPTRAAGCGHHDHE